MSDFLKEELRIAKTQRMHAVYEREKRMRESADIVIRAGEPRPKHLTGRYYIESSTAAALRRIFEDGEQPFW